MMIYRMIKQYSKFSSLIVWNLDRKSNNLNFWCFTPLSAIFQLYHGDRSNSSYKPITNTRGFAPGFVNYKKGCTRLAAQVIKFTSCLPMVGGSHRILRLIPLLKLVESSVKKPKIKVRSNDLTH
jgi:hypothetical protein